MTFADVATIDDIYAFVRGGLSNLFWLSNHANTTAGESIIANGLRVVGAIKIRAQHVKPQPIKYSSSFFEPVYISKSSRYPPGDLTVTPLPAANSFVQSRVLMPWDGSRFGSCTELNGTGSIPGLNTQVSCEGHAVVFPFNNTKLDFQSVVDELAASDWISSSTRNVVVDTMLFHLDSTMFASLQILFEIQAGGTVTLAHYVTPFKFYDDLEMGSSAIMFILFGFSLLSLGVVLHRYISKKLLGNRMDQLEVPGVLDIGFVVMLLIPVVMRLSWIVASDVSSSDPLWQLDHYPHEYEYVATLFTRSITADGFCSVFGVLLLVRFARYTARCAPVVNTLGKSLSLGVVLVILAIALMFAFAACANVIFGDRQLGFQTMQTSLASLMLGFIGSFDFKPLIEENYVTAFIFFAVFMLLVIIVFLSMFVAVFSDSFDDEMSDTFRGVHLKHILANNPNHALIGSTSVVWWMRTFVLHCNLTVKEVMWRLKESIPSFRTEIVRTVPMEEDIHLVPLVSVHEVTEGKVNETSEHIIKRILDDRYSYLNYNNAVASDLLAVFEPKEFFKDKISHEARVEATACLLLLLGSSGKYQSVANALLSASPHVKTLNNVSTSLDEYIKGLFGGFDHDLIMSLLVMIPQERFGMPGVPALENAARNWQPWHSKMSRKVLTIQKGDITELERDTALNPNGDGDEGTKTVPTSNSLKILCESLSSLNRRIFLGVLACGSDEEYTPGHELDEAVFEKILRYPTLWEHLKDVHICLSKSSLWSTLGVKHWLATQCTCTMNCGLKCHCKLLKMSDAVPLIVREFGVQCYGMKFSFTMKHQFPQPSSSLGKAPTTTFWNIKTQMTSVEFTQLWQKSLLKHDGPPTWKDRIIGNVTPPERVLQLFPNMRGVGICYNDFWKYCCEDPKSQQRQGFPQVFAHHMSKASTFLAWSTFITLLIVCLSVIMLYDNGTVDNVHASMAIRSSLAPSEDSDVYDLDHVKDYLSNVVATIWSGGPTESAKPLQGVNYFIGALRVRQVRVKSRAQQTCNNIFDQYLGASLDPATQDFYQIRVQRDFESLISGRCFGAYDFGELEDKSAMGIPSYSLAVLNLGRLYQTVDSGQSRAHDTSYDASGYFIDIPFNSTTSEATNFIDELTKSMWLDQQTRLIVVEFAVYNLNLNFYVHAQFGFEVTSGGAMYPLKRLTTLNIINDSIATTTLRVTSVCYTLLVLWYLLLLFGRGHGSITPIKLIKKWWDLTMLVMFITSWIWTYTLVWGGVDSLHNDGIYPNEIRAKGASAKDKATLESVLLFLLVLRILVVLCINRNIRLVFDTFRQAYNDLFVLLVLFAICLLAFTVGSLLLFGYYFDGQYNFQNSFFDFLNTVSGGDSSYEDLSTLRPEVSLIFFIVFVITCLFVLFNMVTAVLTGAFREVKDRLYDPQASEEVLKRSPHHSTNVFILKLGRRPMGIEVIQKCRWVWRMIYRRRGYTLANKHGAGGSFWRQQARWWTNIDTQPPMKATVAGIKLLMLHEQIDEYRANKGLLRRRDTDELILENAHAINELNRGRDEDIIRSGEFDFIGEDALQQSEERYHSYGQNRRLPLWDEYLYSKFQKEFFEVQTFCVGDPARLLGIEPDSMWLQALSVHHYYHIQQKLHNVELGENADSLDQMDAINLIVRDSYARMRKLSFDAAPCRGWQAAYKVIRDSLPHHTTASSKDVLVRNEIPSLIVTGLPDERFVLTIIPPKGKMEDVKDFMKEHTSVFHVHPSAPDDLMIFAQVLDCNVDLIIEKVRAILNWEDYEIDYRDL